MLNALRSATRAQPLSVYSNFHIFSKSSSQTLLTKSGKQDDIKMEPRPSLWRQCPAMERDMQLGQMKKVLEGSMEETKRMRKRLTMEIPLLRQQKMMNVSLFSPVVTTPNPINQVSVSVKRAWTKSMRTSSDPLFRLRYA